MPGTIIQRGFDIQIGTSCLKLKHVGLQHAHAEVGLAVQPILGQEEETEIGLIAYFCAN